MGKKPSGPGVINYTPDGTWTNYASYNAGDPNGAGTGNLVALAGYTQTYTNYGGTQVSGNTLVMGDGHKALFLDDSISPGFNGGPRLQNIDVIFGGAGGQLIDLTSWTFGISLKSILGGTGDDIILNSLGNTTIKAGAGNDYIWTGSGNNAAFGDAGNDTLVAGKGNNKLYGGSGDDLILAGRGNDVFDGGVGSDTLDFSKVSGRINIDLDRHTAVLSDATTGAVIARDSVLRFEKIIGTDAGMVLDTGRTAGVTAIGGQGDDVFRIRATDDVLTGGDGSDSYGWTRKVVASQIVTGHATKITDFTVGQDHLRLADFLTGQTIKNPQYSDVVHVLDTVQGTLVSVLAGGKFHEIAMLDNVHTSSLLDLGLLV